MYKVDILTENKDGVYQNDEDFKTGPACLAVLYALSQGAMPLLFSKSQPRTYSSTASAASASCSGT
jgi:hypothetical protein